MTRDQIDVLWQRALHESVKDGEQFTRYHFATLVAAAEREECAKVCEAEASRRDADGAYERNTHIEVPQDGCDACAKAIRDRK